MRLAAVVLTAVFVCLTALLPSQVYSEKKIETPKITAQGAVVYCENTGEAVYSQGKNKKLNPYSITKLMTCLLAVQNLPVDKEVTVSKAASEVGGSSMDLQEGEKGTIEQLLYGALVISGNDAAYALGEAVSGKGNIDKFIDRMNKTAENIGCRRTHFSSCNGLTQKNHYTTAGDMLQILRVALSNDTIRKISGTAEYRMHTTNKHDSRVMKNKLPLLTENAGIVGGKAGYWSDQDCGTAEGYQKNGLSLYIVLLGDTKEGRLNDLKSLISYAEDSIKGVRVIKEGKYCGKVRIRHGARTRLDAYTAETGYAYLPKEGADSLISTSTVMKTNIKAPVKKGTVVGYYKISVGDDVVNRIPLVVHESVEAGWFPSYIGISNRMSIVILAAAVCLLALLGYITAARARARRKRRIARERRIMRLAEEEWRREQGRRDRGWRI